MRFNKSINYVDIKVRYKIGKFINSCLTNRKIKMNNNEYIESNLFDLRDLALVPYYGQLL